RTKSLESRLTNSLKLKEEGLSNTEIKQIEAGYPKQSLSFIDDKTEITNIAFGDRSQFVWKTQKKLIAKGYEHTLDGLFGIDTQNAIISFQKDNQLYPSGTLDEETFQLLFLN
ncbi:MAG: peptidoglycan-binding protein, partial [Bacteroidota bacterium]